MKATKLLLAAALFTGLVSLGFAGPGPDYWIRMNQAAKSKAAAVKTDTKAQPAAKPAAETAAACNTCPNCQAKKS